MEEEQQQQQSAEEGRQVHRLPSLNDLLESEVILGDEDAASSSSSAGEMHSAMEDLSQQSTDVKFVDCASNVSVASSSCVTPVKTQRLTMSTSCHYEQSPSPSHQQKPNGLPRSTSNLSSRTVPSSLRSRLQVPAASANSSRHSTYADGTTSSKNRVSSTSPFASRRSLVPTTTPPSPASSRPAVPPKPAGLSRQPSSLTSRSTTCAASPVASRRMTTSFSSASPTTTSLAAKSFLAAGKQRSNIVRSTPPKAPGSIPPQSPRYATLGRRPKPSPPGNNNSSSTSSPGTPTSDISARETKAAADKFATLPRPRKPSANNLPTASPVKESRIFSSSSDHQYYGTLPRPAKKPINSPTSSSSSAATSTASFKPRTIIYMEKSAQTELSERDVRDGMEASLKLRSLSWQQQNSDEIRQLELLLVQVKFTI